MIRLAFALGFALLAFPPVASGGGTANADEVKAVFIYNFTHYLQWSDEPTPLPLTIGVLGPSGVAAPLREIAKKKTVRGRPIIVKQYLKGQEVQKCHILFLEGGEIGRLSALLARLSPTGLLTVSDREGAVQKGVAINFVDLDGRIHFEINAKALENAGIRANSHLLKLAVWIEGQR